MALWLLAFAAMVTPDLADIRGLMQRLGEALMYGTQGVVGWVLVGRRLPSADNVQR